MKTCRNKDCKEINPEFRSGHATCKKCAREKEKVWEIKNRDKRLLIQRIANFYRRYGITLEGYEKMIIEQDGKCAICATHKSELNRALFVDHCHKTGKVRGLLCNSCNHILGHAKDNIEILKNAIEYLK